MACEWCNHVCIADTEREAIASLQRHTLICEKKPPHLAINAALDHKALNNAVLSQFRKLCDDLNVEAEPRDELESGILEIVHDYAAAIQKFLERPSSGDDVD